jgi:antitoxin component HigA of HigAB toxin-antitoxin module
VVRESFLIYLLRPIEFEAEYLEMLEFMRELMQRFDTSAEPHRSLWRLAAQYVSIWEAANDDMATEPIQGFELLRALADAQGLTQQAMAEKLEMNQSHLSRILKGERAITRKLATKVERFFRVPADRFLT